LINFFAAINLFEGCQGGIEQHKEAVYTAKQYTTKNSQFEKDLTGSGGLQLKILLHREIFFGL
jgi:hypothetical protein